MIEMDIEKEMNVFIEMNIIKNALDELQKELEKVFPEAMEHYLHGTSMENKIRIIENRFKDLRRDLRFKYPEAWEKIMLEVQKLAEKVQEC